MKIVDLTPPNMCPPVGACPSVFEEKNSEALILIGSVMDPQKLPIEIVKKIGPGETVIKIPRKLLQNIR